MLSLRLNCLDNPSQSGVIISKLQKYLLHGDQRFYIKSSTTFLFYKVESMDLCGICDIFRAVITIFILRYSAPLLFQRCLLLHKA